MDFNKILDRLGDFGLFQGFIFALVCIIQIFVGIHMLANVFLMGEPRHRCFIPHCDRHNSSYQELWTSFAIPNITNEDGKVSLSPCERFETAPGSSSCNPQNFTKKTTSCDNFVWDTSEFEETVVSEFNIVCKKSSGGALSQAIFMGGVLLGSAGFGNLADRFGRRTVILGASTILLGSSIGTAFSPNDKVFTTLRFVTAAAVSGLFQTGYIVGVEFIGTSKRLLCANVMQVVFAVGELILGLIAYFVRKWRKLQLAISIPAVVLLCYFWVLPESVRWLISKGKHHKARCTILKAAKWNKKTVPEYLLRAAEYSNVQSHEVQQHALGPRALFGQELRRSSAVIFSIWIVNALVYYGLSLSAAHLGGNVYSNFAILAAVEIPAVLLATLLLQYFGRRLVLCAIMVAGGVACGSTVFIPGGLKWLSTLLAVLGKSFISASFAIIYIYTAEIYPTAVRSTGIGISSMFARVGSILAPFINELRKVWKGGPMIIFAIASIVTGIAVLLLPETHNRPLPETLEDVQKLSRIRGQLSGDPRVRVLERFGSLSPRLGRSLAEERESLITNS